MNLAHSRFSYIQFTSNLFAGIIFKIVELNDQLFSWFELCNGMLVMSLLVVGLCWVILESIGAMLTESIEARALLLQFVCPYHS